MNIVILSNNIEFDLDFVELLAPYKVHPLLNLLLICVTEPSLMVDMTVSIAGGQSIFNHLLQRRLRFAEQNMSMVQTILNSYASMNVRAESRYGSLVSVGAKAAEEHSADLLVIDFVHASMPAIEKLVKICACPVSLYYSACKTA